MRSCLSFHLHCVLIQYRTYYPFSSWQQLVGVPPLDCQRSCLSPIHSYFLIVEGCNPKCCIGQIVYENKIQCQSVIRVIYAKKANSFVLKYI